MKNIFTLAVIFVSTSTFAQTTGAQFTYKCECKTGQCESQENLQFLVGAEPIRILLSDYEYEFSASLKAKKSTKSVPAAFSKSVRYDTLKSPYFNGTMSFLFDAQLLTGWQAKEENKKKGKVVSIDPKTGATLATYSCVAEADDYWQYND
jgi:hypothetical protein